MVTVVSEKHVTTAHDKGDDEGSSDDGERLAAHELTPGPNGHKDSTTSQHPWTRSIRGGSGNAAPLGRGWTPPGRGEEKGERKEKG
jgi:hypothetical protein